MKVLFTFTKNDFENLNRHLFQGNGEEEVAFLLTGTSETEEKVNLLIREVVPVPRKSFLAKSSVFFKIDPDFIMRILKRCRNERLSLILAHSHPFSYARVTFSGFDDYGEKLLVPKMQERIPDRRHGAIVFGHSSVDARICEEGKSYSQSVDLIKIIGHQIEELYPTSAPTPAKTEFKEIHDRQILALGEVGQALIQRTIVGIVGLGGMGSMVFQHLVRLGVRRFIIIDPDLVEESNLSRMVGTRPGDVGKPKVEVIERFGREVNPGIEIVPIKGSVNNLSTALKLKEANVIFCCTDNLSSRLVLNRMAFQYLIPVIDMGLDVQCVKGKIRSAGGRVMVILPDGPCLECMGILNAEVIQRELQMEGDENRYISGEVVRAPSIISLNGVVASLAATEFLNLLTGFEHLKEPNTYQMYRVLNGTVQSYEMTPVNQCTLCKEVKALGDGLNLPCRLDR